VKQISVFLGGPIQYILGDSGSIEYEKRKVIQMLVDTLVADNIRVFSAHIAEGFGDNIPEKRKICQRDFEWMQKCDVFCLLLLPGEKDFIRSDGSCIELGWAFAEKKPIVIITDPDMLCKTSALLHGLVLESEARVLSINDIIENPNFLSKVLRDK